MPAGMQGVLVTLLRWGCPMALVLALASCGGADNATVSGCGGGAGSPITAKEVLRVFNAAGYELSPDDCDVSREVALFNNQGADDAEDRVGHVICGVEAAIPPGRGAGITGDSAGTSGHDVGVANVTCTVYTRGDGADAQRQVAKLGQTVAALGR